MMTTFRTFTAAAATLTALLAVTPPFSAVFVVDAQKLQADGSCPLVTFIPFTDLREGVEEPHNDDPGLEYGYGVWPDAATLGKASYSMMAAAEMARDHFNSRNPEVVPELADLGACPIRLTGSPDGASSWYYDSQYTRSTAVDHLLALPPDQVCAVIGPRDARSNEGVSVITESMGVPQVAYATIDRRLARQQDFPNFVRVIPAGIDFAALVALYVQRDVFVRDYVAIIYDATDYGEQFEDPLEDAEDALGYETITEHFVEGSDESLHDSLSEVVDKGYRTIVLVTDRPAMLNNVARVADEMGLLGEGYLWILTGDAFPPALHSTLRFEVDSPADRLMRGAAVMTNFDPFVYNGARDKFLTSWRSQNSSLVDRLNALLPGFYTGSATYFQDEKPAEYTSFMYDSIIATGVGACWALQGGGNATGDHYGSILESAFQGASGSVKFKFDAEDGKFTNSRDASGAMFGAYNVRAGAVDANNMRQYDVVLTSIYSDSFTVNQKGEAVEGGWVKAGVEPFVFFDGTTNEPMPLITVQNEHFLSQGVRIAGLVLASLAMMVAVLSAVYVFVYRQTRLVKAAQPEFLYLLCFGAALVGASIVFISFDENTGWSQGQLDAGCSAFPWFFVIGYLIMYCALFSKLWRLSKLLQMGRRVVQIQNVLWPFCFIILASIAVLIAWQVVDPLQWVREVISTEPFETYGECKSANSMLPYIIPLGFLFAVIMVMTSVISWKLKDVQTDLAESRWIFFGIVTHLQTWAIGIPIVVITSEVSRDASYIMYVALAFIFSVSLVAMVIWPKIYVHIRDKYFGGPPKSGIKLSINGASTRVSGLGVDSDGNPTFASGSMTASSNKVAELERQVAALKQQLEDYEQDETDPEASPSPTNSGNDSPSEQFRSSSECPSEDYD